MSLSWQLQRFRTNDVDDLSMALPGWTQRYTKLDRGAFQGDLTFACGDGLQVYREQTCGAILQEGETDGRMIGLAIPVRASGAVYSLGLRMAPQQEVMGFFAPRRLNLRTPHDFELMVVGVERRRLADFDPSCEPATAARLEAARLGRLPAWLRQHLVDAMQLLLEPLPSDSRAERCRTELMDGLAEALVRFEARPECRRDRVCRQTVDQAVARVRLWMDECPHAPLNVAILCRELGIPRRTLQYSFEQALGITPLQYLKTVRLAGVRRMLKHGETSVLQACLAWGFEHPSAFARDYHALFGERPSSTRSHSRVGGRINSP